MQTTPQVIVQPRRRNHWARKLHAVWRDSMALLREFHRPILIFLLVTVGLGYIYGELYYLARGETIDLIDRPYLMIQLMLFSAPDAAPREWYLVIFWYALPLVFVFIVGDSVSEFVRLFFNRDERRDAWREAVASTYRNHIVVLGAGHVGLRVIRSLAEIQVDVVVIDNDPDLGVDELLHDLDIPLIVADALLPSTWEKVGLRHADALVVCTGNDHLNLDVIMRARDMNPNVRIIARMWNDQFANQLKQFMNVQTVISSSSLSAPTFTGAALGVDITHTLEVNNVIYSMLRLTVNSGSFLENQTIETLQRDYNMDIVLHGCGDDVEVEPEQHKLVLAGDTLVIFARHERILDVASRNREPGLK